jgi:hypothetical protein
MGYSNITAFEIWSSQPVCICSLKNGAAKRGGLHAVDGKRTALAVYPLAAEIRALANSYHRKIAFVISAANWAF